MAHKLRCVALISLCMASCAVAAKAPPSPKEDLPPEVNQPADAGFFEYRSAPELGQISITDNQVRGLKRVQYLKDHAPELAEKGVFACVDEEKPHIYRRSESQGDRTIKTLIVIQPPTHEGEYGDAFSSRLIVWVDGKKKVDCTLGPSPDGEIWVRKVVLYPEDGTLEIHALNSDGAEMGLPEGRDSLDDPGVVSDESFYEDDPSDEASKGTIRV